MSRSPLVPIGVAFFGIFVVVSLVFFLVVAAFIASSAHSVFSGNDSGPSISVPDDSFPDDGSTLNQP